MTLVVPVTYQNQTGQWVDVWDEAGYTIPRKRIEQLAPGSTTTTSLLVPSRRNFRLVFKTRAGNTVGVWTPTVTAVQRQTRRGCGRPKPYAIVIASPAAVGSS